MSRLDDYNFYNDPRVIAGMTGNWYERIDEAKMLARVVTEDDDGNEVELDVPFRWEVCDLCEGRGKHVNPSIDAGGLSREDFDDDPDFESDYMAGTYDVACNQCQGRRVAPEVDPNRADAAVVAMIEDRQRSHAEWAAESAAERRMGA